ncbi:SPRY domain-containing protein 7 [Condylostylus longicornis]|uniref:SPRY domain-containing protein 7 n=1 Tax=Condylostylus longicornis TaxID=2530218 RepID=UPI00244E346F|nr:SPRY domain-containing protein 7 [Condylostylus longicornis]XP_055387598.1 SPRY domain-containing protein 7 [Condylostylus longicornis]XP_055387599.1 SPRY domain-containing protein 7 [Condylostylus longicornis]
MTNMFCCFRNCFNGDLTAQVSVSKSNEPEIQLDNMNMGHEVVIVKNGRRLCGSGGALASAPLVQSKSYFEVKIQQGGVWSIGLATRQADLNKTKGGTDKESWCLCSDNVVNHNDEEVATVIGIIVKNHEETVNGDRTPLTSTKTEEILLPQEGDTIGVAFDHVELNFYLNGKNLEVPVLNVKGTVYPALYVDDGAILDIILNNFSYGPPPGFEKIMIEQSLL